MHVRECFDAFLIQWAARVLHTSTFIRELEISAEKCQIPWYPHPRLPSEVGVDPSV